ncbi:MAG: sigma-70 family RNA polymerase sigma factor [Planctomycetes bacterium]|nr:sigma-70 family RNA polymerase sigma factor [Planctomycetota bacterium]MCB9918400.1 sigma-70 family RNA polymerase sigma factor [Planctomycetota bacterium]
MSLSEPTQPEDRVAGLRRGGDARQAEPARERVLPRALQDANVDWRGDDAKELVDRIVSGDTSAASELVDRFQGRVFRLVRRMWARDRQLVEDLVQEVFLRVFRALPRFGQDCALGAWIHRITINVCISELRKRKALKRDRRTLSLHQSFDEDGDGFSYEPAAPTSIPGTDTERRELFEACRRAISELPELWRVILTLRDLEGRSYDEIAEILDLPKGTVRSRLHRARARVRARLDGEEEVR